MRKALLVGVVVLFAVTGCKRKLKLEGKVTGFKPGTDTLMLHVVSEKGVSVSCEPPGYGCKRTDVGASGQVDIELEDGPGQSEKKVHLKAKIGPRESTIVVDPAASMPPTMKVAFNRFIECVAKDCSGSIDVVPAGHIDLIAPAGTVVDIGTSKLTVGAGGHLDAAWVSSPAAKDQALTKIFASDATTFGSSNMTLTFPDKTKVSAKFDLTTDGAVTKLVALLKAVASGPVLFPWEKSGPVAGHAALYCRGICFVGAAGGTLADVRVVALSEEKGQRKTTCSYTNRSTGKAATANLTMHDHLATAYERTTGRKLGTKSFEASSRCESEVAGKPGASLDNQDSTPDGTAIAQWAAGFAR